MGALSAVQHLFADGATASGRFSGAQEDGGGWIHTHELNASILIRMANQSAPLTDVFYALADPTRRAVVSALGRGPESVSTLAAPFPMALPSFMKHISVLERSGVIRSNKVGRVRTCELVPTSLSQAERWLAEQRATWEARTDRMTHFVEKLHQEEPSHARSNRRQR